MSMHLAHPALTTTGKKKGKKKWASAEHKRRAETAQAAREAMLKEYNIKPQKINKKGFMSPNYKPSENHYRYERDDPTRTIKSVESTWAPCARPPERKYTGTLIKGIATMHKSNAVPVINEEEMISISRMRRG
jgi:hypothetical protein